VATNSAICAIEADHVDHRLGAGVQMSGSSLLVAVNAFLHKRLPLPEPPFEADAVPPTQVRPTAPVY
jgi:hypothetical protein